MYVIWRTAIFTYTHFDIKYLKMHLVQPTLWLIKYKWVKSSICTYIDILDSTERCSLFGPLILKISLYFKHFPADCLKSSIYSKIGKILSFDIVSVLKIFVWTSTFMWDMFHYSHFNNYQSLAACSKPSWLNQNVSYFCGCIQKFD